MKVLITGAAGFIGSHTAEYFSNRNHKVVAVDNFSVGKTENLKEFRGTIKPCDITDKKLLQVIFNDFRPDFVVHLAAQSAITTAWADPTKDLTNNVIGTLNVLALAKEYEVKKFVFSSTSAVYGKGRRFFSSEEKDSPNPDTPYGISKLACEQYIRLLFPNHVILRYANIYGPRQQPIGENQVVARAFRHFLFGDDFHVVGDGKQKRDFVYVSDIAYLNFLAATSNVTGTFNACSQTSLSVNNVLSKLERHYGVEGYAWAHSKKQDERGSVYLNRKLIVEKFGWIPIVSMETGLEMTAEWWKGQK